jgi:beta-lactamase superfamily II metal-dependent hydrolase
VDAFLQEEGIDRLDVMMATHIHIDHMGGMMGETYTTEDGILEAYDVGEFLDSPGKAADRSVYGEVLQLLQDRGIPRTVVEVGDTDGNNAGLVWDPEVSVRVLSSGQGAQLGGSGEGDRLNNDSIALRLSFGEVDIVMGGDAEVEAEQFMLSLPGVGLESEMLKIHHHGRDDASISPFLDRVNPRAGLIPIVTYESTSGTLPSGAVLSRMRDRAIDIYSGDLAVPLDITRTGDDGHHVTVLTDGSLYEIRIRPSSSRHFPPSAPGGPREDLP